MNVIKFKSIYFLLFFSFFLTTAFGQKVSQIRAIKGFKGEVGAWGVKRGDIVSPAKDWIFYEVEDLVVLMIPQDQPTVEALQRFIRNHEDIQKDLFGETYTEFRKKGKKKGKKPKPTISVVCKSKPNCNYTCAAILDSEGHFIRCTGDCCESGPGVWEATGNAAETMSL